MDGFTEIKTSYDDFEVEYEIVPVTDEKQTYIANEIAELDKKILEVKQAVKELDVSIDRYTNHADIYDYATAVTCGVISGVLDAAIVGEWNFSEAKKVTNQEVNMKVIAFAKKFPDYNVYCEYALEGKGNPRRAKKDPDRLDTAIEFLEWKFPLPGDGAYAQKGANSGISGKTHRLVDLCHHPTLVGLIACIIVQFTGKTMYIGDDGKRIALPIEVNDYGNFVGNTPVTKLFAGVINWFIVCAKTKANQKGHLMSDMATSAGIPGSFLSLMMELACIPGFQNADFLKKLKHAYEKGIGTGKNQVDLGIFNKLFEGASSKMDARTEQAIAHELKRQALPVVLNEVLVRGVYFVRHFVMECKEKGDVEKVDWSKVIPLNNRTVVRMMTIATGTFTAVDMVDAAMHAAPKSTDLSTFAANMVLRVNFPGIGRVFVAVASDAGMGIAKEVKRNERIRLLEREYCLLGAKVYYKQAEMWIAAENTGKTLAEAYVMMEKSARFFRESMEEMKETLHEIGVLVPEIEEKNNGLLDEMIDVLEWG